jgi:hypothetical protein
VAKTSDNTEKRERRANVHSNSLKNMQEAHPTGHKARVGRYWRVKRGPGDWPYVHTVLAENLLGRKLNPNERVYFVKPSPRAYKDPQPGDIEIRIVAPKGGRPPGRRRYMIRKIMELQYKLEELREQLGDLNEYYGKDRNDMTDPSIPRDWKPKR